ncbi:SMP-30/gluconolactonase/LRE family protein [Pseudomonas petrae]|uniref:SMP-30/gluconolactonase/LRE family protein n=1 Tax=Pseudomonas petrae TaxID=2912190 RepID=A0ABS9I4S6_9PSED|nr:SMP-30/gluconolactonase/LRE family protein [Pseudomonas petrae]MCF7532305.1 SMP-30/gluconolactonase/LRE family protein [Pseudomonas petrae]MCF7535937.1 SMP-30/gluconolactonase/LRE family protein [Pseudomonas petrae]MCF7542798.1 SMP-30/gluconolactonase/LRE family protein [Pseudomonas petrae]MCF7555001.1 SMP-30/gluconolactonase/LRE family protein [Pseudomonas petrae]
MSLYAPPRDLPTRVFTTLPEKFWKDGDSDWVRANKPGQKVKSFLEGPSFDRQGNLYVTDIPYGRIFRIDPQGNWTLIAHYDGWPNGLKIHRDGSIFVADYKQGILTLDPETGALAPFLTHSRSEGFKGVNDLFFDANGTLYFTDQGQTGQQDPSGRVYAYDLHTQVLTRLIDNGPSPNGLVMDLAQKALFVAMTRGNAVWRLPIQRDGGTGKVGIFTAMAGGVSGADGMALDSEGNLYVCDAGNACVWVFDPHAVPLYRIRSCTEGRTLTNLAFGGIGNRQLFITDSSTGSILVADLEHSGQPMFSHS